MSSNNHSFTITDERLEWERTDPWKTSESPEESGDGDGEGETVVKSSERRRTLMIAGAGALAGGLLGALLATMVVSSPSGPASPQPPVHVAPVARKSTAVVLGPAAPAHKSHPKVTHQAPKAAAPIHKAQTARTKRPPARPTHTSKGTWTHTRPASTARIHSRSQKPAPQATHNHRPSR